jgi:hypothetical protein
MAGGDSNISRLSAGLGHRRRSAADSGRGGDFRRRSGGKRSRAGEPRRQRHPGELGIGPRAATRSGVDGARGDDVDGSVAAQCEPRLARGGLGHSGHTPAARGPPVSPVAAVARRTGVPQSVASRRGGRKNADNRPVQSYAQTWTAGDGRRPFLRGSKQPGGAASGCPAPGRRPSVGDDRRPFPAVGSG